MTGRSRSLLATLGLLVFSLLALFTLLPTAGYRPSWRYLAQGDLWAAKRLRQIQVTDAFATTMAIEGSFAYLVGGQAPLQDESRARGLTIWSLSDPSAPELAGFLDGFFGYDIALKDGHAYIASGGELVVVDVRDTVRPRVVQVVPAAGLFELHQVGRELYLLTATAILLYAVDEPAPRFVQTIADVQAHDVAAVGATRIFLTEQGLLYFAPGENGQLQDQGSLQLPSRAGYAGVIGVENELGMVGMRLVATGLGGWHVVDFSQPTPAYLAFHESEGADPAGLAIDYPYLFLADRGNGILIYDVTALERPVLVGYDRELMVSNVFATREAFYVSSRGLAPVQIVRFLGR